MGTTTIQYIPYIKQITPIVTQFFIVIITASLAYWLGMKAYIKQRRAEEIRKTYIVDGIEKVMSDYLDIRKNLKKSGYQFYK